MQDIDLGEETGSSVEEEQAADQDQGAEETMEEGPREERFRRKAPDNGLRRSRRLEQRPRRNHSDMVSDNGSNSDGETFLASSFSTESEGNFCRMEIAREISTGPGQRSVEEFHGEGTQQPAGEGNLEGMVTAVKYRADKDTLCSRSQAYCTWRRQTIQIDINREGVHSTLRSGFLQNIQLGGSF